MCVGELEGSAVSVDVEVVAGAVVEFAVGGGETSVMGVCGVVDDVFCRGYCLRKDMLGRVWRLVGGRSHFGVLVERFW